LRGFAYRGKIALLDFKMDEQLRLRHRLRSGMFEAEDDGREVRHSRMNSIAHLHSVDA
jgi:hypothetical protein